MNPDEHKLVCTAEEGVEIAMEAAMIALRLAQVACKGLRFGMADVNFLVPDGPDNRQRLTDELNDLLGLVRMMRPMG